MKTRHDMSLALAYAFEAHRGQRRIGDRAPYITHIIKVIDNLREHGVTDYVTLSAAALHDVLEDCPQIKEHALRGEFGSEIVDIVKELTNDNEPGQKERMIEKLKTVSAKAITIKLADRIDNLSDGKPDRWHQGKMISYTTESVRLLGSVKMNPNWDDNQHKALADRLQAIINERQSGNNSRIA